MVLQIFIDSVFGYTELKQANVAIFFFQVRSLAFIK